jgi:hypothetical protein
MSRRRRPLYEGLFAEWDLSITASKNLEKITRLVDPAVISFLVSRKTRSYWLRRG